MLNNIQNYLLDSFLVRTKFTYILIISDLWIPVTIGLTIFLCLIAINKKEYFSVTGIGIIAFGTIFHHLLFELQFQTFRVDLEPWKNFATAIAFLGVVILTASVMINILKNNKINNARE